MNVSLVKSLLVLQFVDWETLLGTRSLGLHITSVIEDLHRTAQLGPSIVSLINHYACVPDEHLAADCPDGLYLAARDNFRCSLDLRPFVSTLLYSRMLVHDNETCYERAYSQQFCYFLDCYERRSVRSLLPADGIRGHDQIPTVRRVSSLAVVPSSRILHQMGSIKLVHSAVSP